MIDEYGGQYGAMRKFFDERNKELGIPKDKTYAEIESDKKEAILDSLKKELSVYQETAKVNAQARTIAALKQKLDAGELEGDSKEAAEKMVNSPSLFTFSITDEDFGDKHARVKELLKLIENPDEAQKQAEQTEFCAKMKNFSERYEKK